MVLHLLLSLDFGTESDFHRLNNYRVVYIARNSTGILFVSGTVDF